MSFFNIYADESRQTDHDHMLIGMLLIPRSGDLEKKFVNRLVAVKKKHRLVREEFKWNKLSNERRLLAYKDYLDVFFDTQGIEFKCLRVETASIDYETYMEGDEERGLYWFFFMAISRNMKEHNEYWLHMDRRNNKDKNRTSNLQTEIESYWTQRLKDLKIQSYRMIVNLAEVDSAVYDQLQIADILMGAVGYCVHGMHKHPNALPFKCALLKHIETRVGCDDLAAHTGRDTRFNIWPFRFNQPEAAQEEPTVELVDGKKEKEAAANV